MKKSYWNSLETLTFLQEDDALMTEFEDIFVNNPDENKPVEAKPVVEKKPRFVSLLVNFIIIGDLPGRKAFYKRWHCDLQNQG